MGKHASARFFELYKQQKEENKLGGAKPGPTPETGGLSQNGEAATEGIENAPNNREFQSRCDTLPLPSAAGPCGKVEGHIPVATGQSQPLTVSFRRSTIYFGLILTLAALIAAYVTGFERGRHAGPEGNESANVTGGTSVSSSSPNAPTSINSAGLQASHTEHAAASRTIRKDGSKSEWSLVLRRYQPQAEALAKEAQRKLNEEGFPEAKLARDNQHIYLFHGKYTRRDDPKLLQYKAIFSGRAEFRDCFIRQVAK